MQAKKPFTVTSDLTRWPMGWKARTAAVHLAMVLVALLFATAASAYTLKFPAHGEDLPYGHYWYTSVVHVGSGNAHDLSGRRYDFTTGTWYDELPTGSDLAASILFGQPIYASADGEIVSCWREFPDWPAGNEYDENDHRQTLVGNHLSILTNDGHLVTYAHMQNLSASSYLCPNGSVDGWLQPIGEKESRPRTGTLYTEYLVPEGQRVQVRTGQFLGRVGHSGNSGGPHLHIQVEEVTVNGVGEITQENSVPIQFTGALYQSANNANPTDWAALNNTELNPLITALGPLAFLPDEGPKVSISSRAVNRLDVFQQGASRQLQFMIWNGSDWGSWNDLGGTITSAPACTSWSSTRIDCVARGQDLNIYHKYWTSTGSWSSWTSLGGVLTSAPAITSRGVNRLDVFARGTNNALYIKSWNGFSWSSWVSLDGELSSSPACTASNSTSLDCFARGRNGRLWQRSWTQAGGWQDWTDRGGVLTSAPSVSSRQSGRLDVFARGGDWQLYFKYFSAGVWSGWSAQGGVLTSAPASASWSSGRIDIAVRGQNQNVWGKFWSGAWSNWRDIED